MSNSKFDSMALGWPQHTGLPMFILVDEGGDYLTRHHEKGIEFQINKNSRPETWNFCRMTLDGELQFPLKDLQLLDDCDLTDRDIQGLRNFVKNNRYALEKMADEKIYALDFWDVCIKGTHPASSRQLRYFEDAVDILSEEVEDMNQKLRENKETGLLTEMSNIVPKFTRLPVAIWIDDAGYYRDLEHQNERIKFKDSSNNWCPVLIDGTIPESVLKCGNISDRDKRTAKIVGRFLKPNEDLIKLVWDQKLTVDDFKECCYKYGETITDKRRAEVEDYIKKHVKNHPEIEPKPDLSSRMK